MEISFSTDSFCRKSLWSQTSPLLLVSLFSSTYLHWLLHSDCARQFPNQHGNRSRNRCNRSDARPSILPTRALLATTHLPPCLEHTHVCTNTHTHAHTHTHSHSLTYTHTHTHSHSLTYTHTHTLSLTHTHTHPYTHHALFPCAAFLFREPVKENSSLHVWLTADFHSGARWS